MKVVKWTDGRSIHRLSMGRADVLRSLSETNSARAFACRIQMGNGLWKLFSTVRSRIRKRDSVYALTNYKLISLQKLEVPIQKYNQLVKITVDNIQSMLHVNFDIFLRHWSVVRFEERFEYTSVSIRCCWIHSVGNSELSCIIWFIGKETLNVRWIISRIG